MYFKQPVKISERKTLLQILFYIQKPEKSYFQNPQKLTSINDYFFGSIDKVFNQHALFLAFYLISFKIRKALNQFLLKSIKVYIQSQEIKSDGNHCSSSFYVQETLYNLSVQLDYDTTYFFHLPTSIIYFKGDTRSDTYLNPFLPLII